jgi:hypothetical protein
LALERGAVGLGGAASEVFDVVCGHGTMLAHVRLQRAAVGLAVFYPSTFPPWHFGPSYADEIPEAGRRVDLRR